MSDYYRLRTIHAALLCAIMLPALAHDLILLDDSTETPLPGGTRPFPQLVAIVLNAIDKDDVERLDQCLAEQKLKRADYASLLSAVGIRAGAGHKLWFVRPVLEPYCFALYGAHTFQSFLVEENSSASGSNYRLIFKNGGDSLAIYSHQSHGLNDIESTGCSMAECWSVRMSFDGQKYHTVSCSRTTFTKSLQEVVKPRRCDRFDLNRN